MISNKIKKALSICLCSASMIGILGFGGTMAATKQDAMRARREYYNRTDGNVEDVVNHFHSTVIKPFFKDTDDGKIYHAMCGLFKMMRFYYDSQEVNIALLNAQSNAGAYLRAHNDKGKRNFSGTEVEIQHTNLTIYFCYNVIKRDMNYDDAFLNALAAFNNKDCIEEIMSLTCKAREINLLSEKGIKLGTASAGYKKERMEVESRVDRVDSSAKKAEKAAAEEDKMTDDEEKSANKENKDSQGSSSDTSNDELLAKYIQEEYRKEYELDNFRKRIARERSARSRFGEYRYGFGYGYDSVRDHDIDFLKGFGMDGSMYRNRDVSYKRSASPMYGRSNVYDSSSYDVDTEQMGEKLPEGSDVSRVRPFFNFNNACYMNAAIAQLYFIDSIRDYILALGPGETEELEAIKCLFMYFNGDRSITEADVDRSRTILKHNGVQRSVDEVYDTVIYALAEKMNNVVNEGVNDLECIKLPNGKNLIFNPLLLHDFGKADFNKPLIEMIRTGGKRFENVKLGSANDDVVIYVANKPLDTEGRRIGEIEAEDSYENQGVRYQLSEVVIHNSFTGSVVNGKGHYYLLHRDPRDGAWYEVNDFRITKKEDREVRELARTNGLWFVYKRVN